MDRRIVWATWAAAVSAVLALSIGWRVDHQQQEERAELAYARSDRLDELCGSVRTARLAVGKARTASVELRDVDYAAAARRLDWRPMFNQPRSWDYIISAGGDTAAFIRATAERASEVADVTIEADQAVEGLLRTC